MPISNIRYLYAFAKLDTANNERELILTSNLIKICPNSNRAI